MASTRGRELTQDATTPQTPISSACYSDAVVGSKEKLWRMADKVRNKRDALEYEHVVVGLKDIDPEGFTDITGSTLEGLDRPAECRGAGNHSSGYMTRAS